jgi:coniferyl-aldehyde dehydrogenase
MIKMSEITPATNAVLTRLLGEVFQEEEVAVVGEELTDPAFSLRCPSITLFSPARPTSARSSCGPLRKT